MPSSMGGTTSSTLTHPPSTHTATQNLTKHMIRAVMISMEQEDVEKMPTMASLRTPEDPSLRLATTNQTALPTMTKEALFELPLESVSRHPLLEQITDILLSYSRRQDLSHWRSEHHGGLWTRVRLITTPLRCKFNLLVGWPRGVHRAVLLLYSHDHRLPHCQHPITSCAGEWALVVGSQCH